MRNILSSPARWLLFNRSKDDKVGESKIFGFKRSDDDDGMWLNPDLTIHVDACV